METAKLSAGAKIAYILLGIVSLIAGMWLFMYPVSTEYTLGWVLGVMMIAYGIVAIISYFANPIYKMVFRFYWIFGIALVVVGFILVSNIHSAMNFLGILLGIVLLVDACFRAWLAFEMKGAVKGWWAILVFAILTGIVGCMFLFNPASSGYLLTMLVGAMFLSQGFLDLSVGIFGM